MRSILIILLILALAGSVSAQTYSTTTDVLYLDYGIVTIAGTTTGVLTYTVTACMNTNRMNLSGMSVKWNWYDSGDGALVASFPGTVLDPLNGIASASLIYPTAFSGYAKMMAYVSSTTYVGTLSMDYVTITGSTPAPTGCGDVYVNITNIISGGTYYYTITTNIYNEVITNFYTTNIYNIATNFYSGATNPVAVDSSTNFIGPPNEDGTFYYCLSNGAGVASGSAGPYGYATGVVGSIIATNGSHNVSSSKYASVLGGTNNYIDDGFGNSTIAGGYYNKIINSNFSAWGEGSGFIGSGYGNVVTYGIGVVCGGNNNLAGYRSFVGSGYGNKCWDRSSVIVGGGYSSGNTIVPGSIGRSFIGAGDGNDINNQSGYCNIVGGLDNDIGPQNLDGCTILGGSYNKVVAAFGLAYGYHGDITASLNAPTILNGYENLVTGYGYIPGIFNGYQNKIDLYYATVGSSWIGDGYYNQCLGAFGTILNGQWNRISQPSAASGWSQFGYSFIATGESNSIITATNAVILSGKSNTISGCKGSTVLGGNNSTVTNSGCLVFGDGCVPNAPNQAILNVSGGLALPVVSSEPGTLAGYAVYYAITDAVGYAACVKFPNGQVVTNRL